jgi:nucleotide-binding universal stress UspA family protein
MKIPTQIVLPTDFSPASMSAVRVAVGLAQIFHAKVLLLHVFQYVPRHRYKVPVEWMVEIIREDVRKKLVQAKGILHEAGVDAEVMVLEDGIPAQQILAFVESFETPFVVMGTHAVGGMERFILGSTAEEVLRQAHYPVVTVGPHVFSPPKNGPFLRRILFATDFSEASLAVVPGLSALQKAARAQLQILHVSADYAPEVAETQEFDSVRQLLGADGGAEYVVLHGANIAQAVVNEAERYPADLVVLGVKRASAFVAHVAPKTAFQVIAASPCAVLTVSS